MTSDADPDPMRVLMVTMGYPKHIGDPTAPFMDAIVQGLAGRGHAVDVVLPAHPHFQHPGGKNVRFFPYRYSPLPRFAPWGFGQTFDAKSRIRAQVAVLLPSIAIALRHCLARRLAAERYDVVHAHWVIPNGWLAASVAGTHGVPVVLTLHGTDVATAERYRLLGRLVRNAFEAADEVTATSSDLCRRAIALGADPRKTNPVYIGVDTERFSPRPPDPEMRRRLGADENTFLVVAVGRLASVKGFEYLIAASERLTGATIAIVGDGELRGELERRARLASAPVILAGAMPHDQVADALAASDVVVVPSVMDRAGRVDATTSTVPEALAAGRPLVATNAGGIPEIVVDADNGLLVPQKDPDALAAALRRLQDDHVLRTRLAARAREFALEQLTWEATIVAFEQTYDRVALEARRRSG